MSSSNIKRETTTQVTIEHSVTSDCDSRSSSETSHSNPGLSENAVSDVSSDEYTLAQEDMSGTYILKIHAPNEFAYSGPKRRPKTMIQTKVGSCNCDTSKHNLLASDLNKKYDINVPEVSAKYSSLGIIKIPIEVRLSLKESGPDTPVERKNPPEDVTSVPGYLEKLSTKCIYQDCSALEYMEMYLDELVDSEDISTKRGNDFIFNGECPDHYVELYHKVGYVYSEDQFKTPIDPEDLIPAQYYAKIKEPFPDDEFTEKEKSIEVDHDSRIHWEDVCLPPKGTVDIAPTPLDPDETVAPHRIPVPEGYKPPPLPRPEPEEEKKKKKGCGLFSCCGEDDDDDDDDYKPPPRKQTSLVFKPVPKTSLIYGQQCMENEPYTRRLLKAYPQHEKSDSPCSSETEMPWPKILLPEVFKIRSVDITEVRTEPSSNKDKSTIDLCICTTCASHKEEKNNVTFRDNKLETLYPPPKLPFVQSKSNTFKSEVPTRKEPVVKIKTKLSGKSKSDEGIMRTKVTLSGKDVNRLLESQGKIRSSNIIKGSGCPKLGTKQICPPTSQGKVSATHSAPCVPHTCPARNKVESKELSNCKLENKPVTLSSSSSHTIKPDPVIAALIACEAELKPVKQALNTVQQKLRNMNMPELDSIFSKGTELANLFLNKAQQNRCTCATGYVSGYNPNTTTKPVNVTFMNNRMRTYDRPISSYPTSYKSPPPSTTYMPQRPKPYVEQRQFGPNPYYGQYQSSSLSQSSSCAPSVQNFSMRPNYNRSDVYPDERVPSKSAFRKPGNSNKQHVKYQRDQSEDWRSTDRSERNCCCSSSNYSSHNRLHMGKSDDEITLTSSSSPSEDSMPRKRSSRRRHRRLVSKVKSKNSGIVSRQSLCPFLEAMKSIMILDNKKTVKRGVDGVSYDTKLSTKKIKNMRMHMRVRTSKVCKK